MPGTFIVKVLYKLVTCKFIETTRAGHIVLAHISEKFMITINNLHKRFGKLDVLKDIDLSIEPGKITAIVGPNGSGKTTLIKCILGLVKPDKGEIRVGDVTLNGHWMYRKEIGYMPQTARFPDNLTGKELLRLIRDLRKEVDTIDEDIIETYKLQAEMNKPVRNLSGGTKQKLNAAIAFLFSPRILIMDEPTAGLDPVSSSSLKDKINKEKENGKTIILTSHIMSEVQELSDSIVILLEGKKFFDGPVSGIVNGSEETTLERAVARIMREAQQ